MLFKEIFFGKKDFYLLIVHLVEELWVLWEMFCFKFIRDKGCPDPDPKWFIPDPEKSFGSDRVRIRLRIQIHNTDVLEAAMCYEARCSMGQI